MVNNLNPWMGGKFQDGLLPECDALPPGPHCFQVQLNYVDRNRDHRVTVSKSFTLPIADADGIVPPTLPKPQPPSRNRTVTRRPTSPVPAPELTRAGATLILRNGDTGIDMSNTDAGHGWRWYQNAPEMDAVIEDCLFEGNNARNFYAAWHAGAMKCIPACRKVTVRRCAFRNNNAAAVWFDHAHGQIVVTDNLFENNRKAVFYEISEAGPGDSFGAFIANNRVIGSVQRGVYH